MTLSNAPPDVSSGAASWTGRNAASWGYAGDPRYEIADAKAAGEPKQRVLRVLSNTNVPDVRDIVLISLADACGILENLLPDREFRSAAGWINQIRNLDLVGRSLSKMLGATGAALATLTAS